MSEDTELPVRLEALFNPKGHSGSLDGRLVLEVGDARAHYCGRLLADLGADVYRIEPPGGVPERARRPFPGDGPKPDGSLYFAFYNANKKSLTLDLREDKDLARLRQLLDKTDILIESLDRLESEELGLTYQALHVQYPGLIVTTVTGFGRTGPYRDFLAPDIVTYAMGGLMHLSGLAGYPPVVGPCELTYQMAGTLAAYGTIAALYRRETGGVGQHVETSVYEVQAALQGSVVSYAGLAEIPQRRGSEGSEVVGGIYPAKDGFVHLHCTAPWMWKRLLDWIGRPEPLIDPKWENRHIRARNAHIINPYIAAYFQQFPKATLYREGQSRHIPIAPVNTVREFLEDGHARARGVFLERDDPRFGRHLFPGAPFRMSETPWKLRRSAPAPGQHNEDLPHLLQGDAAEAPLPVPGSSGDRLPLEGIRVLDFTQALAGPLMTGLLGEFGAEIIKIESGAHQQRGRFNPHIDPRLLAHRQASWNDLNRNKLSISLNMGHEEASPLLARLIRLCDVLVDNFSPRVLPGWGFDYFKVRDLNPKIIMVSMPGFGMTGLDHEYVSVAPTVMALSGLTHLWGHPGYARPHGSQTHQADYAAGAHAAVGVMAALFHCLRTGTGQYIDQGQIDSMAALLGPAYLDASVNHRDLGPEGNRSGEFAPYGCYPCKQDQWCVIAVTSQGGWDRLRAAIGNPAWTEDPRFATLPLRLQHREALDRYLEQWTREHTARQVMWILQHERVAAGAVQDAEALFNDAHLRAGGFFARPSPPIGEIDFPGPMVRLSNTPARFRPCAGFAASNTYVFGELLGLASDEIQDLTERGVVA